MRAAIPPTPDRLFIDGDSDSAAQSNSILNNGPVGPGQHLAPVPKCAMASYSRPNCAELEASPVSLRNWAGPPVTIVNWSLS